MSQVRIREKDIAFSPSYKAADSLPIPKISEHTGPFTK
jgi:hypothetical protein